MNKWFQIDERTELVNGRLSFIFLGLTQFALYVAIVYQRYIEGVPNVYYNDVAIIMILSILGYWAARFYFGEILRYFLVDNCSRFTCYLWGSL